LFAFCIFENEKRQGFARKACRQGVEAVYSSLWETGRIKTDKAQKEKIA
jgi:hypothetical protein